MLRHLGVEGSLHADVDVGIGQVLTIAVQEARIQDHVEEGGWFNSKDVFVKDADLQNRMLNVFGMYWHIIVKAS